MNLDQVATFLAVVRARNFRAAARVLGLSQAAVSQHIRKLEQSLGVPLLARHARGCAPTPEGAEFIPYAESLLRLNARALAALRGRRIAVGASSNIGIYLLQPYLKSYLEETGGSHPVDICIHPNPVIADKLDAGEIDVAAMEWWDERPGSVARPWRREELVVIVPRDHPWATRSHISRAMLEDAPILGGEPGTGTGRLLARYFGDAARELSITMRLGSTEAVKQAVKAGLGVSLVLAGTVAEECRTGTLAAVPLEGERPSKDLYIVCRESLPRESPSRRFAEWLVAR